MLKWEIYIKKLSGDLKLVTTLFEEAGYTYNDAQTYCKACFDLIPMVNDIWIFCAKTENNQVVCKDHYFAGE